MSWWGRRKEPEPEPSKSEPSFAADTSAFEEPTNFASVPSSSLGGSSGGSSGNDATMAGLQAAIEAEQQMAAFQAVASRLTDLAFTKCVHKPSTSLSSSEQSCINATVLKYIDTGEFVVGRLTKAQGGGGM